MTYRERQRLSDIQAEFDAIRSHLQRGDLSDGLVFDAVRIRLLEIGEAVKASWSCVHQPSSPSSSANVPVGPSLPIVAIRTMFRALISTGRPSSFFTPPSSVAV